MLFLLGLGYPTRQRMMSACFDRMAFSAGACVLSSTEMMTVPVLFSIFSLRASSGSDFFRKDKDFFIVDIHNFTLMTQERGWLGADFSAKSALLQLSEAFCAKNHRKSALSEAKRAKNAKIALESARKSPAVILGFRH